MFHAYGEFRRVIPTILLATITAAAGKRANPHIESFAEGRIHKGKQAPPHKYPWLVQIRRSDQHLCGGFIYNEEVIITAAHCFLPLGQPEEYFHIVAGEHNTRCIEGSEYRRKVVNIQLHDNFDKTTYSNDIAILRVKPFLQFSSFVSKSDLAQAEPWPYGAKAEVAGWGILQHNSVLAAKLFKAEVSRVADDVCKSERSILFDPENAICYGKGNGDPSACEGDSGGPLHCKVDGKVKVCGIISVGNQCGFKDMPSTFTKLPNYLDWLERHAAITDPIIDPDLMLKILNESALAPQNFDTIIEVYPKPKIPVELPTHLPLNVRADMLRKSIIHQVDKYQKPVLRAITGGLGNAREFQKCRSTNEIFARGVNKKLIIALADDKSLNIKKIREPHSIATPEFPIDRKRSTTRQTKDDDDDEELLAVPNMEAIGIDVWWEEKYNGTNVVVGHIDSGARHNHSLVEKNWLGKTIPHRRAWYDPVSNQLLPYDDKLSHGTHTLGIAIGSRGIGAAPGAKWVSCRTDFNYYHEAFGKLCMEWMMCQTVVDDQPCMTPHVVTNSWASFLGHRQDNYDGLVDAWRAVGLIPIFASGNTFILENCSSVGVPGDHPDVITVGNMDTFKTPYKLEPSSSRGPSNWSTTREIIKPDLVAPGTDILSALSYLGNNGEDIFDEKTGTSMATPHVAGAVAVLLSKYPGLTYDEIRKILIDNIRQDKFGEPKKPHCGTTTPSVFPNNEYGHGFLRLPDPKGFTKSDRVSPNLLVAMEVMKNPPTMTWDIVIELTPKPQRVTNFKPGDVARNADIIRGRLFAQCQPAQDALLKAIKDYATSTGTPEPKSIRLWITNEVVVKAATKALILTLAMDTNLPIKIIRKPIVFHRPTLQGFNDVVKDDVDQDGIPLAFVRMGIPEWWNAGFQGTSKVIGHINTGVNMSHPMLKDNIYKDKKRGWFDAFKLGDDPEDYSKNGTGTHSLSVILGNDKGFTGGTNGDVRYGVARNSKWASCPACEDTFCLDSTIKACVQFMLCTTMDVNEPCEPALIVFNNWGVVPGSYDFEEILYPWIDAGIVPVFAAGDYAEYYGCGSVTQPADPPDVITVGAISFVNVATSRKYRLGPFSGRGPALREGTLRTIKPDIVAPGVSIKAASHTGGYKYLGGSGVAAAHVAGAVALMMSRNPTWKLSDFLCKVKVYVDQLSMERVPTLDILCGDINNSKKFPNHEFGYGLLKLPKPTEDKNCL